ncbi:MAG: transposase [Candidatus Eiseniibacteriota bacterium]
MLFPELFDRPLTATFDVPHASSDGGAGLLKTADRRLGLIARRAGALDDDRAPGKARHGLEELLGQRIYGYTITYTNPGSEPVGSIVIQDMTPAFTLFDSASCGPFGAGLTGCAVTTAPAAGGTGPVAWTLAGTLDPGASGSVSFRVRVW